MIDVILSQYAYHLFHYAYLYLVLESACIVACPLRSVLKTIPPLRYLTVLLSCTNTFVYSYLPLCYRNQQYIEIDKQPTISLSEAITPALLIQFSLTEAYSKTEAIQSFILVEAS